jgi:hypothetical protein
MKTPPMPHWKSLQQESFNYFLHETNPANGLVVDKNEANWPASIAAAGLALAADPIVEGGHRVVFLSSDDEDAIPPVADLAK